MHVTLGALGTYYGDVIDKNSQTFLKIGKVSSGSEAGALEKLVDAVRNEITVKKINKTKKKVHKLQGDFLTEWHVHLAMEVGEDAAGWWADTTFLKDDEPCTIVLAENLPSELAAHKYLLEWIRSPRAVEDTISSSPSHGTAMTQRRPRDDEPTTPPAFHTTHTRGDTLEDTTGSRPKVKKATHIVITFK